MSVILSAERERIRNTLKRKNGLPQPFTHLACRLGRCFCLAEVSTGHPHLRNDKATAYCTHLAAFVATKRCVILSAEHERIRNSLFKGIKSFLTTLQSPAATAPLTRGAKSVFSARKTGAPCGTPVFLHCTR